MPAGQLTGAVLKTDSTNSVIRQYYYAMDAAGNRTSEQVDAAVTQAGATGAAQQLNQVSSYTAGGATRFQGTISPGAALH